MKKETREERVAKFDTRDVRVGKGFTMFPWANDMWAIVKGIVGLPKLDVREVSTEEGVEITQEIALKIIQTFANKDGWGVRGVGLGVKNLAPRQRKWWIPSKVDPKHRGIIIERNRGTCFIGFYNTDFWG